MLKATMCSLVLILLLNSGAKAQDDKQAGSDSRKILIAFFSKTNSTKVMAEQIQAAVGGDLFHVYTKVPYPDDYRETTKIARAEQADNARPELKETIPVEDMEKYDVIFLGYPNWYRTIPMALFTFLEQYDLTGKTIIPFCTHEGTGLGRGPEDIKKLCPNSNVLKGLAVRGTAVERSQNNVTVWLRQLGYIK